MTPGLLGNLCLVPQVFNAQRFDVDLRPYPILRRIYDAATRLDAFTKAVPGQQPDAEQGPSLTRAGLDLGISVALPCEISQLPAP